MTRFFYSYGHAKPVPYIPKSCLDFPGQTSEKRKIQVHLVNGFKTAVMALVGVNEELH